MCKSSYANLVAGHWIAWEPTYMTNIRLLKYKEESSQYNLKRKTKECNFFVNHHTIVTQINSVFAVKTNIRNSIFLEPDGVNLWYFKLKYLYYKQSS